MSFLYPNILWALLLIAIPIAIHIFDFRKHKTVFFSNVSFIKKVNKETRKKSKLKQRLILSARILAIISLVIAFAQPLKRVNDSGSLSESEYYGVYIDNSFSMSGETAEGNALENAKQKALEIIYSCSETSKITILTNNQFLRHKRFYGKEQAVKFISEIEVSPISLPIKKALQSINSIFDDYAGTVERKIHLISDYQKVTTNLELLEGDSLTQLNCIVIDVIPPANIYIDSCWFETPARHYMQKEQLKVKVVNDSDNDYDNGSLRFLIGDSIKALANFNVGANSIEEVTLNFLNDHKGYRSGRVEISDYPITYDNTFHLSYEVQEKLNVLLLGDREGVSGNVFGALFGDDEYFNLEYKPGIRLLSSDLIEKNFVIINGNIDLSSGLIGTFSQFVKEGGSLMLIPDTVTKIESYNALLSRLGCNLFMGRNKAEVPVNEVNYDHAIYKDVFDEVYDNAIMPKAKNRLIIADRFNSNEEVLLRFADKRKAFTQTSYDNGKVFVFGFNLDLKVSDFIKHELAVPSIYNPALQSVGGESLFYTIGEDEYLQIKNEKQVNLANVLVSNEFEENIIPGTRINDQNNLQLFLNGFNMPGIHKVTANGESIHEFALNYSLQESVFEYFTPKELSKLLEEKGFNDVQIIQSSTKEFGEVIDHINNGQNFWKLFIAFGLMFLVAEMLITRFM